MQDEACAHGEREHERFLRLQAARTDDPPNLRDCQSEQDERRNEKGKGSVRDGSGGESEDV